MLKRAAVIEVERPGDTRMLGTVVFGDHSRLFNAHGIAHIKNHRGIKLLRRVKRRLDALLVKHVGGRHGVAAAFRFHQQVLHGLEHTDQSPSPRFERPRSPRAVRPREHLFAHL